MSLSNLRDEVAKIDASVLRSLAKRKRVCEKLACVKNREGLSLKDSAVEYRVFRRNSQFANELGLSNEFVCRLTRLLIKESFRWQRDFLQKKE